MRTQFPTTKIATPELYALGRITKMVIPTVEIMNGPRPVKLAQIKPK